MLTITLIALVLAIPLSSTTLPNQSPTFSLPAFKASLSDLSDTYSTALPLSGPQALPLGHKGGGETKENTGTGLKIRKVTISATLFTRIVAIALLFAAMLTYNCFSTVPCATLSLLPSVAEHAGNIEAGSTNTLHNLDVLDAGVGLYSGLIYASTLTQSMEVFLLVSGALILLPWAHSLSNVSLGYLKGRGSQTLNPTIPEYPMLILFTTMGGTFLLASADLVSMYLSIELQSFGVYILAAIYRDSESATAAGLKYFLLGALSSALILLGSALIYSYTGLTNLNSIYELISVVPFADAGLTDSFGNVHTVGPEALEAGSPHVLAPNGLIILGLVIISVGLLFKVASAPFHYWAPDVYDGTPTIVTTWLTVMPKISIFLFLLELYIGTVPYGSTTISAGSIIDFSSNLLLTPLGACAFLSLVIGTVVGLGQYRIKRLLAYSTISHVGFLLLALAIIPYGGSGNSLEGTIAGEESVEAFLFYIVQYSMTNINAFFVLLAFGYLGTVLGGKSSDINLVAELQGQFRANPVLGLSFAICLFSMAGVPPLVGFFAKYTVLYSAINNGYVFLAIVAILASVVSAVYYLRIIRVIHFMPSPATALKAPLENPFDGQGRLKAGLEEKVTTGTVLTSVHSYIIASLTLFITLFAVNPTLILNSTSIMALSLYSR